MKKNIALLLGGDSAEAAVSEQSAAQMLNFLDHALFEVFPITIRGTSWTYASKGTTTEIDKNDFSISVEGRNIRFDGAVPMIHGAPGEDGLLPAYLDLMRVPYITCGVLASSLTFNKHACKTYLNNLGIHFPKGKLIRKGEKVNVSELFAVLGLPCFVKPNSGGSSFGVTKIKTDEELNSALNDAFAEDAQEVLVEEFIEGTEITCGIVKLGEKITVFPITEIVPKKDFFDVESKYTAGMAEEITPARISESLRSDCEIISTAIYKHLNCRGVIRIDYIVRNGILYFLEVNTVPGMSALSIIPQQIAAAGQSVKTLYTNLINEALDRNSTSKH